MLPNLKHTKPLCQTDMKTVVKSQKDISSFHGIPGQRKLSEFPRPLHKQLITLQKFSTPTSIDIQFYQNT